MGQIKLSGLGRVSDLDSPNADVSRQESVRN